MALGNYLFSVKFRFVGTDNNGLEGLEAEYDEQLSGENGRIVSARDSVGGEMPFHYVRQAAIVHAQKQVKEREDSILELQRRKQTLEEELVAYINSASAEFSSIPQYQAQVFDIESRYSEHKRITLKKQSDLNAQIKQLDV